MVIHPLRGAGRGPLHEFLFQKTNGGEWKNSIQNRFKLFCSRVNWPIDLVGWQGRKLVKPMKNSPKIDQKSTKNPPKIHWKSTKNRSWRRLGASWSLLGPLGVSWRPPGAPRARPGGVLGRLGGVLVANMAPTWLPKRNQNRLKIEAKNDQNFNAS